MLVLLSGGVANMSIQNCQASIYAARGSGARVVAVGRRARVDKAYLREVISANGGLPLSGHAQALHQA
jgi:hypothetical protein